MRILLPDGNERSSLAVARSLLGAGHQVVVPRETSWTLAASARGVERTGPLGDPATDPEEFTRAIARTARRLAIDVVLPVTDPSVEALLTHRTLLPAELLLPFPARHDWFTATDKEEILTAVRAAGLDLPETMTLRGPGDPLPDFGPHFFPAVVKPHRSVIAGNGNGASRGRVVPVADAAACAAAVAAMPTYAFPLLLQQEIRGPGEGLFLLRWDDRIVAAFAHRRLREKPPWGGVSVYRESIPLPPALLAAGTALLERARWRGVAMIECKRDLRTGRHVFMEINGRFWGSLQLAIDAGVDFPRLLLDCIAGVRPLPVTSYRVGVRSRWFWGDMDHLYLRLRHGPARWGAIGEFLAHRPGRDREEIWRWRDPAPFIAETWRRLRMGG